MKLVTSALGRWGLEPARSSTSAKVQIIFGRCKLGGGWEVGGSCPPLTDVFFTNRVGALARLLFFFRVF